MYNEHVIIHTLTLTDVEVQAQPHKYPTGMPLPTYEQSEKYEAEGVLDYHQQEREEEEEEEMERTVEIPQMVTGTWCEFLLFFLGEWILRVRYIYLCIFSLN